MTWIEYTRISLSFYTNLVCVFSSSFLVIVFLVLVSRCGRIQYDLWSALLQRNVYVIGWSIDIHLWRLLCWPKRWCGVLNAFPKTDLNLWEARERISPFRGKWIRWRAVISTYRLPAIIVSDWVFIFVLVLTLVVVDILGIVAFWILQRNVWLRLMLFDVDGFVEEIVDDVVLWWLLANVIARRWHANQMDLVEDETFRTHPRVLLVLLTVMEHLAIHTFVGVVSVGGRKTECEIF